MDYSIKVTSTALDAQAILKEVETPAGGAVNVFIGTVRNSTKNKKVVKLEFEAYEPMATKELTKIVEKAFEQWPLIKVVVQHRTGVLNIGEVPVIIAVATAHRKAGFLACEYIIDTLKQTVPIWKKELFEDGAVWVAAHP